VQVQQGMQTREEQSLRNWHKESERNKSCTLTGLITEVGVEDPSPHRRRLVVWYLIFLGKFSRKSEY